MKTEELKAKGLSEEQIKFVMAENGKSIEQTKKDLEAKEKELETANAELTKYKKQAEDAQKLLEGFNGVDVEQLKKDIETYKQQAKDAEETYKKDLAERDFQSNVSKAIREAKGLNEKAIMALLDVESLRASKNQDSDIKAAIEGLKKAEDSKMLFTASNEGRKPSFTGNMNKSNDGTRLTKSEIMAIKDSDERREAIKNNMDLFATE